MHHTWCQKPLVFYGGSWSTNGREGKARRPEGLSTWFLMHFPLSTVWYEANSRRVWRIINSTWFSEKKQYRHFSPVLFLIDFMQSNFIKYETRFKRKVETHFHSLIPFTSCINVGFLSFWRAQKKSRKTCIYPVLLTSLSSAVLPLFHTVT